MQERSRAIALIGRLVSERSELRRQTKEALCGLQDLRQVDQSRVVAVGFCFGGLVALEMARANQNVKAVVCCHGGLNSGGIENTPISAKILVCTGVDDPFVTQEQRYVFQEEMKARQADWQMLVLSKTQHAFMNPAVGPAKQQGCAYQADSARRSWQVIRLLFEEVTGNASGRVFKPDESANPVRQRTARKRRR